MPSTSQLPEFSGQAGAAFLLSEPAHFSADFPHPEGRVIVREGAPNVTINLLKTYDQGDVKAVAWRVIQESLDFLAARRQLVLATAMGDSHYVLWFRSGDQYDLTCVLTWSGRWSMSAQGTVGSAGFVPSQQVTFTHHNSLRFYRMSQCARGLFDAYRNAYLALECLVSDIDAKKPSESELDWLKRVIRGPLAHAVPSGIDVKSTLEDIYRDGRNPLFHAKTGEAFYPPHGAQTEKMQNLFERLTLLLVSLLQFKLGTEVVRRWATLSGEVEEDQARVALNFDEVCFDQGTDKIAAIPTIGVIDSPRRFGHLWGKVSVIRPKNLLSMTNFQFLNHSVPWMQFELEETVEMSKVSTVTFEINFATRNLYAPKAFHME